MSEGEHRYARLAARLLRNERPETQPRRSEDRRDAIVAAMTLAIAERDRRRRLAWGAAVALAAAASVLFVVRAIPGRAPAGLVVERVVGAGSVLVRGEAVQPLADKHVLAAGDTIRSSQDSNATFVASNGTHLTLSSAGRLRIDELGATKRFSLGSGRLQAQVAKLSSGERFVVITPDSEVEVRGTLFDVSVGNARPGCWSSNSQSTVTVREGAVWVRSAGTQTLLHAGDSFTSTCADVQPTAPVETASSIANSPTLEQPAARRGRSGKPAGSSSSPLSPRATVNVPDKPPSASDTPVVAKPVSNLAEQNDLLSAAMAAERRGQHDVALRQLGELIRRFPNGPLRESAQAERQRILSAQPAP